VITRVHKVNTTRGPKIIDKDMEVSDYHMWEVYEVNEVCVLKDGVQRVRYKTSPKATIKKTCKGSGVSKHGGAGSSRGRAWCLETIKPTTNTKQREWEEHAKGAQTKWKPHKSKTDGCKKNYEGAR